MIVALRAAVRAVRERVAVTAGRPGRQARGGSRRRSRCRAGRAGRRGAAATLSSIANGSRQVRGDRRRGARRSPARRGRGAGRPCAGAGRRRRARRRGPRPRSPPGRRRCERGPRGPAPCQAPHERPEADTLDHALHEERAGGRWRSMAAGTRPSRRTGAAMLVASSRRGYASPAERPAIARRSDAECAAGVRPLAVRDGGRPGH